MYEVTEVARQALEDADDELVSAGLAARPDLRTHLGEHPTGEELERLFSEIRKAGAEALGQDR